jgi:hypothetical protein
MSFLEKRGSQLEKSPIESSESQTQLRMMQAKRSQKRFTTRVHQLISVADPDPGSGTFLPPGSGIGFFRIPDPTIISESLKHFFYFE